MFDNFNTPINQENENQNNQMNQENETNDKANDMADLKDAFAASKDYRRKPIKTKLGKVAKVFGIISIAFIWLDCGLLAFIPMSIGFIAIILSIITLIMNNRDDDAKVGLLLGIISFVFPFAVFVIFNVIPGLGGGWRR